MLIKLDVLFIVLETILANRAVAVTRTWLRLHDFSHGYLENFRTDPELMHSLLLFDVLAAKLVGESETWSGIAAVSSKNWNSQTHFPAARSTELFTQIHHGEIGDDLFASYFFLHRESAVLFCGHFFNFFSPSQVLGLALLTQLTFSHCKISIILADEIIRIFIVSSQSIKLESHQFYMKPTALEIRYNFSITP